MQGPQPSVLANRCLVVVLLASSNTAARGASSAGLFHGVGLCDEHPPVPYPFGRERSGHDGVLEPGMVVCVESYVGRHGGAEGVKLEDQVLITASGRERLLTFPRDERLSAAP